MIQIHYREFYFKIFDFFSNFKNLFCRYSNIMEKNIPRHLVHTNLVQYLADRHQSLKGRSTDECCDMYMEAIRSWPLYGSTVFDVMVSQMFILSIARINRIKLIHLKQNYTDQIPNNCWLAINIEGIHILQRHSKVCFDILTTQKFSLSLTIIYIFIFL